VEETGDQEVLQLCVKWSSEGEALGERKPADVPRGKGFELAKSSHVNT
jgi:hypothetical protein